MVSQTLISLVAWRLKQGWEDHWYIYLKEKMSVVRNSQLSDISHFDEITANWSDTLLQSHTYYIYNICMDLRRWAKKRGCIEKLLALQKWFLKAFPRWNYCVFSSPMFVFVKYKLTMIQHWFRYCLGVCEVPEPVLTCSRCIYESPVHNFMMTSWNGNIFRVTGHLCGEFTGPRWIPRTKASDAELWCFLWSAPEWTVE